jgi:hypothetical protein
MKARLFATAATLAVTLACGQHPFSRYREVSVPDCPGPDHIIAEAADASANQTYVRVQHIGDAGTDELRDEVANIVTWDVGAMTGLRVNAFFQRGHRDAPPPVAASAFQLSCESAGFFINSSQFSHGLPLFGEGPSATIGRSLGPPLAPFENANSAFTIQARVAVPTSQSPNRTVDNGVAQVSFFYYARDRTSRLAIAHVIGLHDNRPAGTGGSGDEFLSYDGNVAFAGSPLAATDSRGNAVRFARVAPGSATIRTARAWDEAELFRAEVGYAQFKAMLDALAASSLPGTRLSTDPRDYDVTAFGVLAEIFVGTDRNHEVMLGGHARGLTLSRERAEPRVGLFR